MPRFENSLICQSHSDRSSITAVIAISTAAPSQQSVVLRMQNSTRAVLIGWTKDEDISNEKKQ